MHTNPITDILIDLYHLNNFDEDTTYDIIEAIAHFIADDISLYIDNAYPQSAIAEFDKNLHSSNPNDAYGILFKYNNNLASDIKDIVKQNDEQIQSLISVYSKKIKNPSAPKMPTSIKQPIHDNHAANIHHPIGTTDKTFNNHSEILPPVVPSPPVTAPLANSIREEQKEIKPLENPLLNEIATPPVSGPVTKDLVLDPNKEMTLNNIQPNTETTNTLSSIPDNTPNLAIPKPPLAPEMKESMTNAIPSNTPLGLTI